VVKQSCPRSMEARVESSASLVLGDTHSHRSHVLNQEGSLQDNKNTFNSADQDYIHADTRPRPTYLLALTPAPVVSLREFPPGQVFSRTW
jgi:hypothetical protein